VNSFGEDPQVFIVRIWVEPREISGAEPIWRGYIENVPSGSRRYFQKTWDALLFILPYLEERGVKLGLPWRLIRWIARWKNWRVKSVGPS
jgi:hypothetical protein